MGGPRPERPEIAEQYYRTMPDFQLRLQVKAGLTGYAQVYGKDADCIIVAVGHKEFRSLSMLQLKEFFKAGLPDDEKVLIDVKSLYRMDELKASGMRFWRL